MRGLHSFLPVLLDETIKSTDILSLLKELAIANADTINGRRHTQTTRSRSRGSYYHDDVDEYE